MSYTTKQQVENYLQIDISTDLDTQVASWITMAEQYIDNFTDRHFEEVSAIRKFEGNGEDEMWVDDLLGVTLIFMVENDATSDASTIALATTDYHLKQGDDANKTPYNKIQLNENGDYDYFREGQLNIWIEGTWGYSSVVPDDIKMIATKLVASIVKTGKDGNVKSFTEHDYSVTYLEFQKVLDSDISLKTTLNMYRKVSELKGFNMTKS